MCRARRFALVSVIPLGLLALVVPALVVTILLDQARTPLLGIYVEDGDPPVIAEVMAGSGAADAGLRAGDTILAVDGRPYASWNAADRRLGGVTIFALARHGQPLALPVTVGPMLQANRPNAFSAILVASTFWGISLWLLRRRWRQVAVRILYLFNQACAIALLIGLAYPRFRLPAAWLVSLAVAALIMAPPLLLHYALSFPVVLGSPRRRAWVLGSFYGLAALGTLDAWQRPAPWAGPAIFEALLVGAGALGAALFVYFSRASADQRRRLRVVTAGMILGLAPPMAAYILPTAIMGYSPAVPRWALSLSLAVIPLSLVYATARHDLFGIDHLLNRATVYAMLSLAIVVLGLAVFFVLDRAAYSSLLQIGLIAGFTLFSAFTFQPARMRVQRWVDQLFYAGWYDYPGVVERASLMLARSQAWPELADILTREVPGQMRLRGARLAVGERNASTLEPGDVPGLELALDCGGQACGTWAVGPRGDGGDLNPEDRRILQTLSREAEISLSNVLLLETLRGQLDEIRASRETLLQMQHQLLRSREAERGRLARDLHDGPIQALVGMNMQLSMLLPAVDQGDGGAALAETLQGMRSEVRSLLGELRQICSALRPPMLDTLGLGAALRALAEDWSARRGVAVRLELPADAGLRALPEEVTVNLYRVVQEALSNVAHHAAAQHVDLCLAWDAGCGPLELVVRDDGCGFAPGAVEDLAAQGHFGLAGIRERVALIGGAWRLDSAPGQGTAVHVTWRADHASSL